LIKIQRGTRWKGYSWLQIVSTRRARLKHHRHWTGDHVHPYKAIAKSRAVILRSVATKDLIT